LGTEKDGENPEFLKVVTSDATFTVDIFFAIPLPVSFTFKGVFSYLS